MKLQEYRDLSFSRARKTIWYYDKVLETSLEPHHFLLLEFIFDNAGKYISTSDVPEGIKNAKQLINTINKNFSKLGIPTIKMHTQGTKLIGFALCSNEEWAEILKEKLTPAKSGPSAPPLPDSFAKSAKDEAAPPPPQNAPEEPAPLTDTAPTRVESSADLETAEPETLAKPSPYGPSEFILKGNKNDPMGIRIFFAGVEIILDDPDQHLMLTTILTTASANNGTAKQHIVSAALGGSQRAMQTYVPMKRAIQQGVMDAANVLKFNSKLRAHKVSVPIHNKLSDGPISELTRSTIGTIAQSLSPDDDGTVMAPEFRI